MLPDTPQQIHEQIQRFITVRQRVGESVLEGAGSLVVAEKLAQATDALLVELWRAAGAQWVEQTALLALGSYGRGELTLHSDIDLMIEVGVEELLLDGAFHQAVERFMTWCRDAGLKLGHAVRTPAQTRQEFEADARTPISMLDARLLGQQAHAGEGVVRWETVRAAQAVEFLRGTDGGRTFVELLMQGYRERIKRNGKTIYLLEPDIKSGEGGLRDLNCIHWAGRVRWEVEPGREVCEAVGWTEASRQTYARGLAWVLGLRNILHVQHGRKHDRLTFPDQEKIAAIVLGAEVGGEAAAQVGAEGLSPSDRMTRAESLMREHYREARAISMLAQRSLRRWESVEGGPEEVVGELFGLANGQLGFRAPGLLSRQLPGVSRTVSSEAAHTVPGGVQDAADGDFELGRQLLSPAQVFDALEIASQRRALLGPVLEQAIVDSVRGWGARERADAALCARFCDLLTDPQVSPRTSRRLLETGVLSRLIPEFEPIICHVQHDVYHIYTTDVHSLRCLEKARRLVGGGEDAEVARWPLFGRIGQEIQRGRVFLLAALFHDIGKNRGGDHSRVGAELMEEVGRRLGLNWGDVDRLAFLVREHLTLSDTARRRDLSDPRVIRELAGRLRTVEALNELAALTFCDMATVGPNVMTDWNAALIADLYHRLRQAIDNELESLWRDLESRVDEQREALLRMAHEEVGDGASDAGVGVSMPQGQLRSQLDAFMRDVPADHVASADPWALRRQFQTYALAAQTDTTQVRVAQLAERGVSELIVCTRDVPGTLAKIAGVISASGLNIMAAQIVTTASGRTLDIFQVSQGAPLALLGPMREQQAPADPARLQALVHTLVETLDSGDSVEQLLKRRLAQARLAPRPTPPVRTLVDARQDISDAFTVIEVRAPDRVGLLYEIARTLWEHGVSTHVSKIDSLGTQIIDTFYVEGPHGGKLDDDTCARLTNALYDTLKHSPYLEEG